MSEKKVFLEHIAGLRGIAIILIVLFHLKASMWPQGYLGVDIFLVMTGYLLFRGRFAHIESDSLKDSLKYFWRRIQRIILPMSILIVLTLGLGLFFLNSSGELFACREGYNACFAKANIFLQREFENYFAADSAYMPLLHLWYLSVALQIYLIYTVGNYCIQRLTKRCLVSILTLIGVVSLLLHYSFPIHEWLKSVGCPVWTQVKPVSYYETLPRLWEVLAGGLILYLPVIKNRAWASICSGAGLLIVLIFGISGATIPGTECLQALPCTLITVLGTMAVIRYLPESHFPRLLSCQPLLWLGKISFSVYLVHMPIIVFWRLWMYGMPDVCNEVFMVVTSILAGWGFWWCIEKRRSAWWLILLVWTTALMVCRVGRKTGGFEHYMPFPSAKIAMTAYPDWQLCKDKALTSTWNPELRIWSAIFELLGVNDSQNIEIPIFALGNQSEKATIVLMGDSHAMHLYAGMDYVFRREGLSGVCLAVGMFPFEGWMEGVNDHIIDWLSKNPQISHVVLSQRWIQKWETPKSYPYKNMDFERDLRRFLERVHALGRHVLVVGAAPEFPRIMLDGYKIAALRGDPSPAVTPSCSRAEYHDIHKKVLPTLHRLAHEGLFTYLDPLQGLGEDENFEAYADGESLMTDDNHLSPKGSILFMDMIFPQLREALQSPAQSPK